MLPWPSHRQSIFTGRKCSRRFPSRRRILIGTRTKIEINPAIARRLAGLDDLARVLFPDNSNHRRAFVALWITLKYSEEQFVTSFTQVAIQYGVSERTVEIVRGKMVKMGLLKRVSHFNPKWGKTAGWEFSNRFAACLRQVATAAANACERPKREIDRKKDRATIFYV